MREAYNRQSDSLGFNKIQLTPRNIRNEVFKFYREHLHPLKPSPTTTTTATTTTTTLLPPTTTLYYCYYYYYYYYYYYCYYYYYSTIATFVSVVPVLGPARLLPAERASTTRPW